MHGRDIRDELLKRPSPEDEPATSIRSQDAKALRAKVLLTAQSARPSGDSDRRRTSLGEWLFMSGAVMAVLVGIPALLATMFQFGLPMLGRIWSRL